MENSFVQACIQGYASLVALAMPVVFFVGACNIGINIVVNAFMGRGLHIGGGK